MHNPMIDEIVQIGGNSSLFGLLTRPDAKPVRGPILVLLNAGLIPRMGPFRLHVTLARQMAARGNATFRFDLPGIGDTMLESPMTSLPAVTMALDAIERHAGTNRFVIAGLCRGADLAWKVALHDPRVTGVLQIDGLARTGFWFHLAQMRHRLGWPPLQWLAAASRFVSRHLRRQPLSIGDLDREWPPVGAERAQLRELLDRHVRVFSLFTGGITSYFLDARQFPATYGSLARDPGVRFAFWPECDHIFFSETDRARMISEVLDWYSTAFGRAADTDLFGSTSTGNRE
jgi:hypothetical protein